VDVAGGLAAVRASGYDSTITLEAFSPDRDQWIGIAASLNLRLV